jgi:hypothetical protein
MKRTISLFFVLCAACGGASQPAAAPSETTASDHDAEHHEHGGHHEHGDHKEHGDLPAPVKDFHAVLGPVWHSDPGAGRAEKACSNGKAFHEKAQATGDAELIADVAALEAACEKEGRPEVEAKLTTVHERFHAIAKGPKH